MIKRQYNPDAHSANIHQFAKDEVCCPGAGEVCAYKATINISNGVTSIKIKERVDHAWVETEYTFPVETTFQGLRIAIAAVLQANGYIPDGIDWMTMLNTNLGAAEVQFLGEVIVSEIDGIVTTMNCQTILLCTHRLAIFDPTGASVTIRSIDSDSAITETIVGVVVDVAGFIISLETLFGVGNVVIVVTDSIWDISITNQNSILVSMITINYGGADFVLDRSNCVIFYLGSEAIPGLISTPIVSPDSQGTVVIKIDNDDDGVVDTIITIADIDNDGDLDVTITQINT